MTPKKLKEKILSLMQDIEFEYNGKHCAICPFSKNDIHIGFDGDDIECKSIDEVMSIAIFDGKTLEQICDEADFF